MAFRRRTAEVVAEVVPVKKAALVAAATKINLDGSGWKDFRLGDQRWQSEAWRHFDICGELRYAVNWIGNAVSRCRIYVAEVDAKGAPGEEVTSDEIAGIAETMFGGPGGKSEALRTLGIHLSVPGESYIVAESVADANKDIWYVASTSEVSRQSDVVKVKRSNVFGGGTHELQEGRDLLIRVWTPHPRKHDSADSSVRAALPILREIEHLTKYSFAQMDSRLAGAGMLFLPDQIDFPRTEEDESTAQGLMQVLGRAMAASLQNREDASAMVPIIATVPGEYVDKIKYVTFETPLAQSAGEQRDKAIGRLAVALDLDPEILLGKGGMNHWGSWQVEESTIKIHIVPVLSRICEALTSAYLGPALETIGEDPEKYVFWFDTSPLTIRPNRGEDARSLHTDGILSDETARQENGFSEDDAPDDEERIRRLMTDLVKLNVNLLTDPGVRRILGLPDDVLGSSDTSGTVSSTPSTQVTPAVEGGPGGSTDTADRSLPQAPTSTEAPAQTQDAVAAALMVGSDMAVCQAMSLAGKRLLTRSARVQGTAEGIPAHLLHTRLKVLDASHANKLLEGAFSHVDSMASEIGVPVDQLRGMLNTYCVELLQRGYPHERELLRTFLSRGMAHAH